MDGYLETNLVTIIRNYITEVSREIFEEYSPSEQQDIKSICVFRLTTLDILERLRNNNLILSKMGKGPLLAFLRDKQFLHYDKELGMCYHDDVLRRIIYLDFSFGGGE